MKTDQLYFVFDDGSIYQPEGDRPLGSGHFSMVWAARSKDGGHRGAVKVLNPDRIGREDVLEAELTVLAKLARHDDKGFIRRAYRLGHTSDGRPCLLLELIEGPSLATLSAELRGRPAGAVWTDRDELVRVKLATQMAQAL